MRDIVWGEWQYEGLPVLGDYVQVLAEHDVTGERQTDEGFVVCIRDAYDQRQVWLSGEEIIDGPCDISAICWRRGALPEYKEVLRRQTVDA